MATRLSPQPSNRKGVSTAGPRQSRLESGDPMKLRVIIEVDEEGTFVAACPSLPGCVSQGATRDEAMRNIQDAIAGYLASLKKHGEPIPPSIYEEVVEIPD